MQYDYPPGATPLDPDEAEGLLLPHITNYTPYNMTSFIIEKITPEIEKEIARMTGRG